MDGTTKQRIVRVTAQPAKAPPQQMPADAEPADRQINEQPQPQQQTMQLQPPHSGEPQAQTQVQTQAEQPPPAQPGPPVQPPPQVQQQPQVQPQPPQTAEAQPYADPQRPKIGTQLSLSLYPKREKKKRRRKDKGSFNILINSSELPFQYKEAFHFLRTNIKFLSANRECKKIVVTSSIPNEGKTTVAINLALSLSAANNSVVLVDADLRKPAIHDYLMISPDTTMGLTDALQDMVDVRSCVRNKVDKKSLYVIPSGMIPPNPTELLGSQRMNALLTTLGEYFDYVILDTPPVSVVTDAAMLSQYTDGVLLVVRQKMASFDQAKIAKANLEIVGARILGVVLNDFDRKHLDRESGYYYNYRRYGQGY